MHQETTNAMRISINKRFVKAGEIVEVTWASEEGSSPRIVMHTGERETAIAVPENGSKKFRLKNAKGSHWIGLRCWVGNEEKLVRRRLVVWGKAKETDAFEYIDQESWWKRFSNGCKRYWDYFSPEKKRLYIILIFLIIYQLLMSFHLLAASQILMTVITFYIFWQVIKK